MSSGRGRRLAAGVAALLLLPTAVATAQDAVLEDDLAGVDDAREEAAEELDEVREAEGAARERLVSATGELEEAETDLETLEAALESTEAELEAATDAAAAARTRLQEVNGDLEMAEDELAEKREQLDARVRAAFKYGQVAFVEAFVGTKDITEFLNSGTYVASVLDADKELVADVTELLAEVEDQRADAQSLREEAEREAAAAEAATAEVERATVEQERLTELVRERRTEREAALEALAEDRSAIEDHLAGLDEESQRIEDQLAEIARQQAEEEARRQAEEEARLAEEARVAEQARLAEEARQEAEALAEQQRFEEEQARTPVERDACEEARASGGSSDDPAVIEACGPAPTTTAPAPAPSPPPTPAPSPTPDDGGVGGEAPPASDDAGGWTRPVGGPVTSGYGPRWGRNHNGVDLGGSVGTTVVAARAGTVVHVTSSCHPTSSFGCGGGFGNYVTVSHAGGMATIYAHLSSVSVGVGQSVGAGQQVGAIGNSGNSYGPHLHFEVRQGGSPRNPCGYIGC